jgi:hypothetical protein
VFAEAAAGLGAFDEPQKKEEKPRAEKKPKDQAGIDKLNAYLTQHDIQGTVAAMMNELAKKKPKDPYAFMSTYLADGAKKAEN